MSFLKNHTVDFVFVKSIRTVDLSWNFNQLQLALNKLEKGDKSEQVREQLRSTLDDLPTLSSAELIDAMMLHTLYTKQIDIIEGNIIFMCVGKAHNAIVAQELSHFGYVLVDEIVDAHGVDMAKVCALLMPTNNSVIFAIVDGIKLVFDAVGSYFGLV